MSFQGVDPARLFQILNNTGLQNKDSQLFQLLFDLIGVVTKLNGTVSSGGGGGGGTFITQNIVQQIIEGDGGGDGGGGDFGPPGPAGLPGPIVPYHILLGEIFNVPINKQALFAMNIDNEGTIDVDGFLIEVDRFGASSTSSAGGGFSFPGDDGEPGDIGLTIPVQGPQGIQGNTGAPGTVTVIQIIEDGIDGDSLFIPGPVGPQGSQGIQGNIGPQGQILLAEDGLNGEDSFIPGPVGPIGPQGPSGSGSSSASTPVFLDDYTVDDSLTIPGPPGPGLNFIDFTQDLGAANYAGNFTIAGNALVVGKNVTLVQTAQPIASKGNATDEFEMDAIELTGVVLNPTTIKVYWQAPSVVVGTYAFAYAVNG